MHVGYILILDILKNSNFEFLAEKFNLFDNIYYG